VKPSHLTPQSILVTGNLGYVGAGVVERLRLSYPGARLVGLDTGFFAHCLTAVDATPERHLDSQLMTDVRDVPREALDGFDTVVHLAAISNDPIGETYERVTIDVNQRATLDLAAESGVRRFVFASSCSVYGASDDGARAETSPLAPLTAYARSKVEAEHELVGLASSSFSVTSLRFATACGMSPRLRLDLVLNDFVASAIATGAIELLSDGSAWRPLIHVDDMARAIAWAAARQPERDSAFVCVNVGSSAWNVRIRDLAEAVRATLPGVELTFADEAPPDRRSYSVDFSAFSAIAPERFLPRVGVEEAVEGVREGLLRMGFSDPRFRDGRLNRLSTLRDLRERGLLDAELRWREGAAQKVA
jgi:nucleoside-diphosphate-sugar epimerase